MHPRPRRRAHLGVALGLTTGLAAALSALAPSTAAPAPAGDRSDVYIVQLTDAPVATYDGSREGLAATAVKPGRRLDRDSKAVKAYVRHLGKQRAKALGRVDAQAIYSYDYTVAGFAAELTADEAARLAKADGIASVERAAQVEADTISTPDFLGLTGEGGTWDKVGGIDKAGDGVIVGVIDSGFVPERPSFAPMETTRKSDQLVAAKWKGVCEAGVEAPAVTCNNKVIGARYFNKGILAGTGAKPIPAEYESPRDRGGHGTHTASTAAGNDGVAMSVQGRHWGLGSGVAPQARLAVYKALWDTVGDGSGSGNSADLVAAIDAATADGVDVINYSISSSSTTVTDAVSQAFMRATRAGVFVATSAGNTGPGVSTLRKNDPWTTAVANGTHDRAITQTVTLGDGRSFTGGGVGGASPTAPLVRATDVKLAAATDENASLCMPDTLDPAKVAGTIVLCERRLGARVDKSLQVKNAGGVGMVLWNAAANTIEAERHSVPTVHVDHVAGAALKEYAAGAGATATISEAVASKARAPMVAATSSRGPSLSTAGDVIKPDVMAPGTGVLAATVSDRDGEEYAFFSGTSMASPHVAGIAALLRAEHPTWSPMAVKSAIMTTATTRDNEGKAIAEDGGEADAFDRGAGQVRPLQSLDPGLVYDSSYADWARFVCGTGQVTAAHAFCADGKIDPSDLNLASIAVGDLPGKQTVTRTVTNVGTRTETYRASVEGLTGIHATVSPSSITVAPGESATFTLSLTNTGVAPGAWSMGALVWKSKAHTVASQIAVRPVLVSAPASVKATGTSGSAEIAVTPGITGPLTTKVSGLVASTPYDATLRNPVGASFPATNPAANEHVAKFTIQVPPGTTALRVATYDADYPAGTDLDLHVYPAGSKTRTAASTGDTAQESVLVRNPSGAYDVYVDHFAGAAEQAVRLDSWLPGADAGNLTVTPSPLAASAGDAATLTASWSDLAADTRWFGLLSFGGAGATAEGPWLEILS